MEWTNLSGQYVLIAALVVVAGLIIYWQWRISKHRSGLTLDIGMGNAIGSQETQNDASGAVEKPWGTLAVLADGTGKGGAGKIASLATVQTFLKLFGSQDVTSNIGYFFTQAFNRSNKEVLERLRGARGGTAAAAVLINRGYLNYASVGDIRIAILRKKELIPLNTGHNMKTAAVKGFAQGRLTREEALAVSKIDRQTNYIGRDGFKNIEIDPEPVRLNPGDTIIIMNASIHKCLSWVEIEAILRKPGLCQQLADRIIAAYNRNPLPEKKNAGLFVLRYYGI